MQVYTGFNTQSEHRCTNCLIELSSQTDYKLHYKSQFHRYNIKRKILGLKPATIDQFNFKKEDTNPEQSKQGKGFECKPCKKSFTNDGMYKQHLQSKKHQEQANKQAIINERKTKTESKVREIVPELCLFCELKSSDTPTNESHMQKQHGFFIHQKEFCKDVAGLIKYLHEKVDVGLLCIYCDNKGFKEFQNGAAIRSHMKDKSHCFMNTVNGFEEYEKFYDFGRLFDERVEDQKKYKFIPGLKSDVVEVEIEEKEKQNKKKQKVNQIQQESKSAIQKQQVIDQNEDEEGDWEDEQQEQQDSEQQWSDVSDNQQNTEQIQQQKTKPKTKKYLMYKPTVVESGQLLLPSGKLLGTRKYRHLYKQYYRPGALLQNRKMLTGLPNSTTLVLKSQKLELYRKQEKQIKVSKLFEKNRDLKLKLQSNKLQYYFRCQTPL